jgi:hypothetical protein
MEDVMRDKVSVLPSPQLISPSLTEVPDLARARLHALNTNHSQRLAPACAPCRDAGVYVEGDALPVRPSLLIQILI